MQKLEETVQKTEARIRKQVGEETEVDDTVFMDNTIRVSHTLARIFLSDAARAIDH